jgi:hypothetical protein
MALGNFERIERIAANGYDAHVKALCKMVGTEFRVYKRGDPDEYDRVWGVGSGTVELSNKTFLGVLLNYELVPVDNTSIGGFTEGFLYTPSGEVAEGDEIEIVRDDSLKKRFHVGSDEQTGQTTMAFQRWKVASIGE